MTTILSVAKITSWIPYTVAPIEYNSPTFPIALPRPTFDAQPMIWAAHNTICDIVAIMKKNLVFPRAHWMQKSMLVNIRYRKEKQLNEPLLVLVIIPTKLLAMSDGLGTGGRTNLQHRAP